jgi:hypothetical protein
MLFTSMLADGALVQQGGAIIAVVLMGLAVFARR